MEPPSSRAEEPPSWEDLYKINLMPSELFVKFRKELQGLRVGVNLELYNEPTNDYHAKLVLKPLCPERKWKFIYEPLHQEVRVQSKKIPVTRFLNLQVGIGHNFQMNAIGWKWKLTSCLGGDGVSRIRNKTTLGLSPGIDFRFGWRADFVLPEGPWDRGTVIQHELRAFRGITGQSRGHYNPFRLSIANPYSSCWACLKEHTLCKQGRDLDNIRRQTCESTSTWCSQPKHKILL